MDRTDLLSGACIGGHQIGVIPRLWGMLHVAAALAIASDSPTHLMGASGGRGVAPPACTDQPMVYLGAGGGDTG